MHHGSSTPRNDLVNYLSQKLKFRGEVAPYVNRFDELCNYIERLNGTEAIPNDETKKRWLISSLPRSLVGHLNSDTSGISQKRRNRRYPQDHRVPTISANVMTTMMATEPMVEAASPTRRASKARASVEINARVTTTATAMAAGLTIITRAEPTDAT
mmetsp:Transcript_3305/g.7336  ORF Transcript_3305/g.7336 Transcript_3305/m.7336 type:complete len:157 (-) Transcript_3305:35-505(-)